MADATIGSTRPNASHLSLTWCSRVVFCRLDSQALWFSHLPDILSFDFACSSSLFTTSSDPVRVVSLPSVGAHLVTCDMLASLPNGGPVAFAKVVTSCPPASWYRPTWGCCLPSPRPAPTSSRPRYLVPTSREQLTGMTGIVGLEEGRV